MFCVMRAYRLSEQLRRSLDVEDRLPRGLLDPTPRRVWYEAPVRPRRASPDSVMKDDSKEWRTPCT